VSDPIEELAELRLQYDSLTAVYAAAIRLITDARFASGDNGLRMLPEFIEYLRELKIAAEQREALAEALRFARTVMSVTSKHPSLSPAERRSLISEVKRADGLV
jgi:hypothetical protein